MIVVSVSLRGTIFFSTLYSCSLFSLFSISVRMDSIWTPRKSEACLEATCLRWIFMWAMAAKHRLPAIWLTGRLPILSRCHPACRATPFARRIPALAPSSLADRLVPAAYVALVLYVCVAEILVKPTYPLWSLAIVATGVPAFYLFHGRGRRAGKA